MSSYETVQPKNQKNLKESYEIRENGYKNTSSEVLIADIQVTCTTKKNNLI